LLLYLNFWSNKEVSMASRKLTWLFFAAVLLVLTIGAGSAAAPSPTKSWKSWNGTWIGDATIVGKCENGGQLFVESGVGFVEQMGKSKWSDKYCMDPTTWTASGRNAVITAENGDKVYLKITLLFTWTSRTAGNWVEHETVIGGTGRFAAASGGSHSAGTFTLTTPTTAEWAGTETGMIAY
jgi:hypothetical protein